MLTARSRQALTWLVLLVALNGLLPSSAAAHVGAQPAVRFVGPDAALIYSYDAPLASTTRPANVRAATHAARSGRTPSSPASTTSFSARRAAKGGSGAENAVSGKLLKRQLASAEQIAGSGSPIIGAGTNRGLRDAPRLAREYGGDSSDWAKMSSGRYRDGGGIYDLFETHWYENVRTGARYEFKTKFPRAENMFGGPGG